MFAHTNSSGRVATRMAFLGITARSPLTCTCDQEYFAKAVGPVKRVIVNYGPNGRARGSATIIFSGPTTAAAAVKLDGTKVDGRPMRVRTSRPSLSSAMADNVQIEMLMGAKNIAPPPPPKSLQDRVT